MAVIAVMSGAALIAPAAAGGHTSSPPPVLSATDFRPLTAAEIGGTPVPTLETNEPDRFVPGTVLVEPGGAANPAGAASGSSSRAAAPAPAATPGVEVRPTPTPRPAQPQPAVGTIATGAGTVMTGWASWYDNGTTAMRLPRGTHVRICGPSRCVNRVVTDYGPDASLFPMRIVDLMPTDFATVCGCSIAKGTVRVTVTIFG